jgi:D-threo-aldose 1-dehydrogenase
VLDAAFDSGIRYFDVARMYGLGAAEKELGTLVRGRRDEITIATKFGIEPSPASGHIGRLQGPARKLLARYPALRRQVKRRSDAFHQPRHYDRATARASLEMSLRELGVDHIDVLYVHDPGTANELDLGEICGYMEEARVAGHIRAWGVAGEPTPCIAIKRSLPEPTVLQIRHHILSPVSTLASDLRPLVTFGIVSEALEKIVSYLDANPDRRDEWSIATDRDLSSTDEIVFLLLRNALKDNPDGIVLFSTGQPERLRALMPRITLKDEGDASVEAFRRRVLAECNLRPVV